jgi:thioredoxin-related protein
MKKLVVFALILLTASKIGFSQEEKKHSRINYVFNPYADAQVDIDKAVATAKKENKQVLIVVGGDWNLYSTRIVHHLPMFGDIFWANYILARICYAPTNKNKEVLAKYGCPTDRGFPVFIILDENGKVLTVAPTDGHKADYRDIEDQFVNQLLTDYAPKRPLKKEAEVKKKPVKK